MAVEVFNRYESKYLIDHEAFMSLQDRLAEYMEPDEYNKKHDFYTISNIYYDTKDNNLIRTSISKPEYKEKLRLRAYGVPDENGKAYMEIKKKCCGLVNKRRTTLRLNEAYEFVRTGTQPELRNYMNKQVLKEIEYIIKLYEPEPKLYLAYDRKAYFGTDDHDLRITFDTNIRTRRYDLRLENGDYGESLLQNGQTLMEIKAGKSLPMWLCRLLSENRIFKTSFSKYGKEYEKMLNNERNSIIKGDMEICSKPYSLQPQLILQYQ